MIAVIPDLHLNGSLILKQITHAIEHHNIHVDKFLFLGDYFDQYNIDHNKLLAQKEIHTLEEFKKKHNCIFLLGNHDIPYITTNMEHYSETNPTIAMMYQQCIVNLEPQLAYEENGILFSHAGLVVGKIDELDTTPITNDNFDLYTNYLNTIQQAASKASGGNEAVPSLVWARPEDWYNTPNDNYEIQIMGHTPHNQIVIEDFDEHLNIYTDTFSLTYKHINHPLLNTLYDAYGDGSFIVVDTESHDIQYLKTNWGGKASYKAINQHLL